MSKPKYDLGVKFTDMTDEELREALKPAFRAPQPIEKRRFKEVHPLLTGFATAGSTMAKALDLPNQMFGNSRSRLQDFYETVDRNIERTRVKDPDVLDEVMETGASLAGTGWTGKVLPFVFGAAAGTDVAEAASAAGVEDPGMHAAGTAAVDTGIWIAGINLASKRLPPHLRWLGPYITDIGKSIVSSAVRAAEYKNLGYDVSTADSIKDSASVAAVLPFVLGGVREIGRANYKVPGTDREVSLREFSQKFDKYIKQKDNTLADAERIALSYVDKVAESPENFVAQVTPEGKALQRFSGLLVQVYKKGEAEGRPRLFDPKAATGADTEAAANDDTRAWYGLYEKTLSPEEIVELRTLTAKEKTTPEEKARLTELIISPTKSDFHITGMDPATGEYVDQTIKDFMEGLAMSDSENRNDAIRGLATTLKNSPQYSPTEKAIVLQAASTFSTRSSRDGKRRLVPMDPTNTYLPTVTSDDTIAVIVSQMRDGAPVKQAMTLAEPSSKIGPRGVPANYTGWKRFDRSSDPNDIDALRRACAGSKGRWCTGESAAGGQLPKGDFHVHFTNGEPDVAIRMEGNSVEEVRGSGEGQRLFPNEAAEAEKYIKEQQASGYQMDIPKGFWADQAFRRNLMLDLVTWRDIWELGNKPASHRAAGEGGAEPSWPPYVRTIIGKTLSDSRDERLAKGYITSSELSTLEREGKLDLYAGTHDAINFRPAENVRVDLNGALGKQWHEGKLKVTGANIVEHGGLGMSRQGTYRMVREWDPDGTMVYENGTDERGYWFERKWDPNGTMTRENGTDERGNTFERRWDPDGTMVYENGDVFVNEDDLPF